MTNPAYPATIDDVLKELEIIINNSIKENDRAGYFAALYYKVTQKVKEGIVRGDFEDGPRMERLDVCFAGRYLQALEQWKNKNTPTDSWAIAFQQSRRRQPLLLQHLLLGINAHINLDLGIAANEIARDSNLFAIQKDFNAINEIIASLIYEVTNDLMRISPFLSLFGMHATNQKSVLIQFSVTNARDGAWVFAQDLHVQKPESHSSFIAQRDKDIAALGAALINVKGLIRVTRWIIHLFEWKNPARINKALHEDSRVKIVVG